MMRQSNERLQSLKRFIPQGLWPLIQAGPIDEDIWCLLVQTNAAAAKLRQLLPTLQAELNRKGCKLTSIRLKISALPTDGRGS